MVMHKMINYLKSKFNKNLRLIKIKLIGMLLKEIKRIKYQIMEPQTYQVKN